jgi:hypothetical protein
MVNIKQEEIIMMKKKAMAYWSVVCPGCNMGRKYPNSFIGKRVVEHWEKGCPAAYMEEFGEKEEKKQKNSEKVKE